MSLFYHLMTPTSDNLIHYILCSFLFFLIFIDLQNDANALTSSLPYFDILDENQQVIATIKGPCCQLCAWHDVEFHIFQGAENQIGQITKKWSGLAKELFTDADNFGADCAFFF